MAPQELHRLFASVEHVIGYLYAGSQCHIGQKTVSSPRSCDSYHDPSDSHTDSYRVYLGTWRQVWSLEEAGHIRCLHLAVRRGPLWSGDRTVQMSMTGIQGLRTGGMKKSHFNEEPQNATGKATPVTLRSGPQR